MRINEEPIQTKSFGEAVILDKTNGTTYVGWATPGTATSVSQWKIMRMVESGDDITITWADGNTLYDNEWDERTGTVSYS